MPISVTCPQCGKVLQARESAAGKRSTCPDCGTIVTIPELQDEVLGFAERPASELVAQNEPDTSNATDGDRKRCPMCGEMISKSAVKCRYCNEFVDSSLRATQRSQPARARSSEDSSDTDLALIDWLLAIFCHCIACIVGVVYLLQGKSKGAKLIGMTVVFFFLWSLVGALTNAIQNAAMMR